MILFSVLTLIMFLWTMYLNNEVRILKNTTQSLTQDIEGASASCGKSLN